MNTKNIILTEQNILAFIIHNKDYLYELNEKYLITKSSIGIYNSIKKFIQNDIKITSRNLCIELSKNNINIEQDKLDSLFEIDTQESIPFDTLYKSLKESYIQYKLEEKCLNDLLKNLESKEFDIEKYYELKETIEELTDELFDNNEVVLTAKALLEKYDNQSKEAFSKFYTTGDSKLDKILTTGFEPGYVNILFARSGVGKTSFALNLINKQINKNIPSIYFSIEMNYVSVVNKILSQRLSIPFEYFYKSEYDNEESFNIDMMKEDIEREKEILIEATNFRYIDMQSLSLMDVDNLIKRAMESMKQKYAIVTIDLLTMLKDFNGENKASKYEDAMNKLHEMAKKNNVSILGVVQTKRLSDKTSVKTIDDLEKFRPTIEEIKNAGAIEERARIVLSLFRKRHEAAKHFDKDSPELALIDDIAEIEVLKQNLGEVGKRVQYLYEGQYSKFTPYIEDIE